MGVAREHERGPVELLVVVVVAQHGGEDLGGWVLKYFKIIK